MNTDDGYLKASRYDLPAQTHNRQVFHRHLVARPWHAFALAVGMGLLGAMAAFNWIDAPRWRDHPWMGWMFGGCAGVAAAYFLSCAVQGWRQRR